MNYGKAMLELVNQRYDVLENAKKLLEDLNARNAAGELSKVGYEQEHARLTARLNQIEQETAQAIHDLQNKHNAAVEAWNQLDASKLTPDAAFFLRDLSMTDSQLQGLVQKHRNNVYMIGVMQAYAKRNPHVPIYGLLPGAEDRIKAFDALVGKAYSASKDGLTNHLFNHYPLNAAVDVDYAE